MTVNTRRSRRQVLAATGTAAALALAGCVGDGTDGGDDGTDEDGDDRAGELGRPTPHVEVEIMTLPRPDLQPVLVHIEVGGTVEWVGRGERNRLVPYHPETWPPQRVPDHAEPWSSGLLREGDRFERAFQWEGIYDVVDPTTFCSTHEAVGVVGRVVVGWPDIEQEPAMQHDVSELPSRAETVLAECNERCRAVLADGEV